MVFKKGIIVILAACFLNILSAQAHASQSLSTSIVSYALGDAVTAGKMGLDSPYKNPAGLTDLTTLTVSTTYATMFDQSYTLMSLGIGLPVSESFFISLNLPYRVVGDIPLTIDNNGQARQVGTFQDSTLNGIITLAYKLSPNLSIGSNIHYYAEQIGNNNAQNVGLDAGILYHQDALSIGASIFNAASYKMDQSTNEASPLSRQINIGIAYDFGSDWTFLADSSLENASTAVINLGGIFKLSPALSLYGGIQNISSGTNLRLGASCYFSTFKIDYAYSVNSDLGPVHKIGMAWEFSHD